MDSPLPAAVSHWAEISQDKKSPFTQPHYIPCLCASKFKACKRQKEAKLPHITLQCFINMITLKLTDPQLKPIRPSPLASLPSAPLRLHPSQVVCTHQAPFRSLCSHLANCTTTSDSRSPVADGSISVVHGLAPRRRSHIFAHTGKENHGRKPRARPPLDQP